MIFSSLDEYKNYILSQCEYAVAEARDKVYKIIDKVMKQFYSEFHPSVYQRTKQLLNSLVMTDIQKTSNGIEAIVYFDATQMSHSMQSILSEEEILDLTLTGEHPHGGYPTEKETRIWIESKKVLDEEAMGILKEELIKSGIPIR